MKKDVNIMATFDILYESLVESSKTPSTLIIKPTDELDKKIKQLEQDYVKQLSDTLKDKKVRVKSFDHMDRSGNWPVTEFVVSKVEISPNMLGDGPVLVDSDGNKHHILPDFGIRILE